MRDAIRPRPAAPIRPAPTCSWRSLREPSAERESLRCTSRSRSMPTCSDRTPRPPRRRPRPCPPGSRRPTGARRRGRTRTAPAVHAPPARAASIAASSSTVVPSPMPTPDPFSTTRTTSGCLTAGRRRAPPQAPSAKARRPASTPVAAVRARRGRSGTGHPTPRRPAARGRAGRSSRSRSSPAGPARLTRYGAWITSGAMPWAASRSRNAGRSRGRLGPAAPRGRVVREHLEGGRADLRRAIGGLDHAVAQRQVGPEPPTVGKHRAQA